MSAMTTSQVAERSEALFQQGFCCAESVLQAIADSRGIESELATCHFVSTNPW
jgi:hypothetical protein